MLPYFFRSEVGVIGGTMVGLGGACSGLTLTFNRVCGGCFMSRTLRWGDVVAIDDDGPDRCCWDVGETQRPPALVDDDNDDKSSDDDDAVRIIFLGDVRGDRLVNSQLLLLGWQLLVRIAIDDDDDDDGPWVLLRNGDPVLPRLVVP
jgi:hypothetical protein